MGGKRSPAGPARGFLLRLAEEKRKERLRGLLSELEELVDEYEKLASRTALVLARIKLLLELLENRPKQ